MYYIDNKWSQCWPTYNNCWLYSSRPRQWPMGTSWGRERAAACTVTSQWPGPGQWRSGSPSCPGSGGRFSAGAGRRTETWPALSAGCTWPAGSLRTVRAREMSDSRVSSATQMSVTNTRLSDLALKWVRLAQIRTNPGLFQFRTFRTLWKSLRFVQFGSIWLTFGLNLMSLDKCLAI